MTSGIDQGNVRPRPRIRRLAALAIGWAAFAGGGGIVQAAPDDKAAPGGVLGADPARRAVAPITPDLPGGIVASLQGGQYPAAIAALDALIAAPQLAPADRAFYGLLRGGAARLADRPDDARATWLAAVAADPAGTWANKLRGELAALELATGHPDRAEALARAEAQGLLDPARKDRLAEVYRDFARKLLEPEFPGAPGNPAAAYALLAKGRDLAKGDALRAALLFAMGRAGQEVLAAPGQPQAAPPPRSSGPADPARDYEEYLRAYPRGADRDQVRFHLAEVLLATGRPVDARLAWGDLARDLAGTPGIERDPARQALRGRSLAGVARTYGMPTPNSAEALSLGVSSLRRLLRETPADPASPRAAFEIGLAYAHVGQADPAIAAFRAFLAGEGFRVEADAARQARAELAPRATFLIARATLVQGRFPEAIAAFEAYLAQYPAGPQSAEARRWILAAQFRAAQAAADAEEFADARAAWLRFVEANPLDDRVPRALYLAGSSWTRERRWDDAIAAWDALAARFPGQADAAHGQFEAAALVETEKGDPAAAIERFRKVPAVDGWGDRAAQRIAVMEAKALTVVTPRTFRSGETAQLRISTRNLESLTFAAYKLNPEAYFRKKHALGDVATLDIGLVAPDAEWTAPVPGYARYKPVEASFDLKVAVPGVYVVKVTDEKTLQASALVIGSDLEAIVKVSRDRILVFAQDMKTGRGRPGARVLAARGGELVVDAAAGPDGVFQGTWPPPRAAASPAPNSPPPPPQGDPLRYLVLDGPDAAGSGLGVPDQVARGLSPRAYIDTDRPAYRPGQEVRIRGVIREVDDGQYANPAGVAYKLEVVDPRGRTLVAREATLSPFGTFRDAVRIDPGAPVGTYRIKAWRPGGVEHAGTFEVQAYQLAKLGLEFDLPRTVYYRGETIRATARARYGYDAPAAGRPIAVRLPDGRTLRGQTDALGQYAVEFATAAYGEDQALEIVAQLAADNVAARANVRVAVLGFGITLATPRDVYLDGETVTLAATTLDALGQPTGQDLRVALIKPVRQDGRVAEREVAARTFRTDPATGQGRVSFPLSEAASTTAILRVAGTDRFGNAIVADHPITVSGRDDDRKLRLVADRTDFKVGEAASVRLINRARAGTALVAWEADRILRYRLVPVAEGENALDWPVEGAEFPNFTLTACRMVDQRFDQARLDLKVERDLRISLRPKSGRVAPGAEVEVEVAAADQLGRPVRAELALALVDRTLLRQFGDKLPPIDRYFYDQARLGSFATEATNTFVDRPATEPVPDAVVDEDARQLALGRDAAALDAARLEGGQPAVRFDNRGSDRAAASPAPPTGRYMNANVEPFDGIEMVPAIPGANMQDVGRDRQEPFPNRSFADIVSDLDGTPGRGQGQGQPQDRMGNGAMRRNVPREMSRGGDAADKEEALFMAGEGSSSFTSDLGTPLAQGSAAQAPAKVMRREALSAQPRREFVETAYWNPSVVTGADGKATVKFAAPEGLSEYRLLARGATGADSLFGEATTTVVVRKDFYVELRAPARLAEGDRPRFAARVHHVGLAAGTAVLVRLGSYAGEQERVDPKTITVGGDGVTEVLFDPIPIPDAESIRLVASARAGDRADEVAAEVPIRPWGVQALATASGTASTDATAFVALPPGRRYDDVAMQVQLAPTLDRLVVELALGRGMAILRGGPGPRPDRDGPGRAIAIDTTADRASDLLAAVAGLRYLREARATDPGEATRLGDRARGLAAALVATQNQDGGWSWVPPMPGPGRAASDRQASAAAAWSLREAGQAGIDVDPAVLARAGDNLVVEFGRAGVDPAGRAAVLNALAALGRANFEQASTLNRGRQNLPDVALAHLALALGALERPGLAGEVLDLLAARARPEAVGPGEPPQTSWDGKGQGPWHRGRADTTALVALAFARVRPASPEFEPAVAWLLAHRSGGGWAPHKAGGPAVAAIAAGRGKAGGAGDRYRLVVAVNDVEVAVVEVPGSAEPRTIPVPRRALKVGAPNAIRFKLDGRGTFGYSASLTAFAREFAPEQDRAGKAFTVDARDTYPDAPEFDGRPLATGFASAVNPAVFVNKATQVTRGGRVEVAIRFGQQPRGDQESAGRDFAIVEEALPAGATVVEGSIRTSASSYTAGDGVLTFAFPPDGPPPFVRYELAGYLPGEYRAFPTTIRDAYAPGRVHLGPVGSLRVLAPDEPATDPYRASPDELLARGRALAAAGRLAEAAVPLDEFFAAYAPTDAAARDAARILLSAHIASYDARKVVRDFEVLKDKGPEVVVPFDEVLVVGRAYRDIGEFERAFLVFRALAEASYLEDAQVGEVLRQNGQTLEAITFLLDLWRDAPGSASIEGDLFGLGQVLAATAGQAATDPATRATLARAQVTRPALLLQSIRLIQATIALNPRTPLADEASLALLGDELDLEDYEAVTRLAPRFAALYPRSPFLDSFQYADALGRFQLGQYDRAIEVAEKIVRATYPDPNGVPQPSPNKWQALYILGQIHDARRQPALAVDFYRQVADRFSDAADAVLALGRRALKLPEVTILRPQAAAGGAARPGPAPPAEGVALSYRNVGEVDVKVYPVDLMRLYLTRRNLDGIAGIDLAGITPLHEATVRLGDAPNYADATRLLDLPIAGKEGAYLVMVRGGSLYASGIVLVSPIELEVTEDAAAGRVRVVVRDAASRDFVPKVQVKVIGSNNPTFTDGRTDLRGVAVAEGIRGQVTAVARVGAGRYAFYRGTESLGSPPPPRIARPRTTETPEPEAAKPSAAAPGETLEQNVRNLYLQNQGRGVDRLRNRFQEGRKGIQAQEAK